MLVGTTCLQEFAINLAPVRHVGRRWRTHDITSGLWLGYALRVIEIGVSLSADSKALFLSSSNVLTLRGRPRNRWQDEAREDGRLGGRRGWKKGVYNREEWKEILRTARNRILLMPME
jgi:hypothetical protein